MPKRTETEMSQDGEFLREYGKQYFVVAVEALEIGRVKWSIVPIGKAGKDDLVFYLPTEDMLALCLELRSGVAKKKIAADAANRFPSAYKYTTGKDGSLHLSIGGGDKGARIQMQDNITKKNYTMAVAIGALEKMAYKFLLDTGFMPVTAGSYYDKIVQAFESGRVERQSAHTKVQIEDVSDDNAVVEEAPRPAEKVEEKKPEVKTAPVQEEPEIRVDEDYTVRVQGTKSVNKGFYVFKGTCNGEKVRLLIKNTDVAALPWYAEFERKAATAEGAEISVSGEKRDDCILVKP